MAKIESKKIKKDALLEHLSKSVGISKKQAKDVIDAFTDLVTKALQNKESVALPGFGMFYTSYSKARTGVNPQKPSEKIQIQARNNPKFKPGKALKDAVR